MQTAAESFEVFKRTNADHSSNRKIAIFIPSFRAGGAERAMMLLGEGALEAGYEVDLIAASVEGPLSGQVPAGVRLTNLASPSVAKSIPKLTKVLRTIRPRVLFSTIVHANLAAIIAGRSVPGLKIVIRECNSPITEIRALGSRASFSRRLCHRLIPLLYPLADRVIAVSEGAREELIKLAPGLNPKIAVLPTPVISNKILEAGEASTDHPWFDDDIPVVMGMGRLRPEKDFELLIDAVSLLHNEQNVRLVIFGEGPHRATLENHIRARNAEDFISLAGVAPNPFPYLRKADAFALTSISEGMPNVLVQSLAFGTPTISTDCKSGPRELLDNGRRGTLIPVGDVNALVVALKVALQSEKRPDIAKEIHDQYSVTTASANYLRFAGLSTEQASVYNEGMLVA